MELTNRVKGFIQERRENILSGGINCIPSPFSRFSNDFVGIEQAKYYLITSATKGSKTQFSSYVFVYHTILYAYYHPDQVRVKILYYPLEETKEEIMLRFISYLLFTLSKGKHRIDPANLSSTNAKKVLAIEVLELLDSEEYAKLLDYFESCIIFSESTNATGVWKECKEYAESNGTVVNKKVIVRDEFTGENKEVEVFDHYELSDPKEYRIIFYDHISLMSEESKSDLKSSILKLSKYFVKLRNRYKFSPVVVQQQAFFEGTDSFKLDKLRPTIYNLADSKATSRDVNVCLGLFSPYRYDLADYLKYDITKLRDNIRFLEVLVNRGGLNNGMIALYFDGAVNTFSELPKPTDTEGMQAVYNYLNIIREESNTLYMAYSRIIKSSILYKLKLKILKCLKS